jgi:feruloyl esterase
VDYYETATRTIGGPDETRPFLRLFMFPGVGHCRGGAGGGDFDWLTAIENWVEKGEAPDQVIVYHPKVDSYAIVQNSAGESYVQLPRFPVSADSYDRTRPVFAYPDVATWNGKGDPANAENWSKVKRARK